MDYHQRIVETELGDLLAAAGAVLVEGPKASGKTATATRAAKSTIMLDVDENAQTPNGWPKLILQRFLTGLCLASSTDGN